MQCRTEHRCRPLIVDLLGPGELISVFPESAGARDDLGFYPHGRVLLARFPEVVLRSVLRGASSDCLLDLIADLRGRETRRLADKSRLLVGSVEDRLRVSIRELASRFGVAHPAGCRIAVGLTCGDWADFVGCERANATRALLHLERHGVIRREGRHVVVVDRHG
jgi:CRP-like cAMP-binding protein